MIRARLFKGLKEGSMNRRTIFDDEKNKIRTGQICNYCGSSEKLALNHISPRHLGGKDEADNLTFACEICNSSKDKKDLIKWMISKETFLPLMVIRRYLKLTFNYCLKNNLLDKRIEDLEGLHLPFRIDLLPTSFPPPNTLVLNIEK